jgi:hypothetical protein
MATNAAFSQVLLHFHNQIDRILNHKSFRDDVQGVIDGRQVATLKRGDNHRPDDFHNFANSVLCHEETSRFSASVGQYVSLSVFQLTEALKY